MIKKIAAIVPGPALFFIGKWLELFSGTHLTYPEWQNKADQIALAGGSVIAIVLCILLRAAPRGILYGFAWAGFALTFILLIACWLIWFHLGTPMPSNSDVMWWQDVWEGIYIAAMLFLVATLTAAGLYEGETHPILFWILFALIVIIVLAIIASYFLWSR
jgi:hypothetical protein